MTAPRKIKNFESRLDDALDRLGCWNFDGGSTMYLAGNIIETAYAKRNMGLAAHLERGFTILAPRLIQQSSGAKPDVATTIEALEFAGHYYALRDYLYYSYNSPGSCEWSFQPTAVQVKWADRSIPRQYWLQFSNFVHRSMPLFASSERSDLICATLKGTNEFEPSDEVTLAVKMIILEADDKLAHYFSLIPPTSSAQLGDYRYCDIYSVLRVLLTKALYHRYQAQANGHVGAVHLDKDDVVAATCHDTGLSEGVVRSILRDLAYSDHARRAGIQPMYFGLFDLASRDQYLLLPHMFSMQESLVNLLRLEAKRDPNRYQATLASALDEGFQKDVRSIFEGAGFTCHERVDLSRFDPALPDVDLLVVSEEPTLGYHLYICELKGMIPAQWSKDYLRALSPKALPKAFKQLDSIANFLSTPDGIALIRGLLPEAGLPHFGEQFVVVARSLVITSDNAGMFFADKTLGMIDHRTLRRIVEKSDGDVTYINQMIFELDSALNQCVATCMIDINVGPLVVEYEAVTSEGGRLLDFPDHSYRSDGLRDRIARDFIETGGHPLDALGSGEDGTESPEQS